MSTLVENRIAEVEQNTSPAILILLDEDGTPVAFNRAARQFIHAVGPVRWEENLHQSEVSRWREQVQSSLKKQMPVSGWFRLRRFDHAFRQFVLRAEPRYDLDGEFSGHHVSGLDVTDIVSARPQTEETDSNASVLPWKERQALAREWHDTLVNEATVIGVSTDVLLELARNIADNGEIVDVADRVKNAAASICVHLSRLDKLARGI